MGTDWVKCGGEVLWRSCTLGPVSPICGCSRAVWLFGRGVLAHRGCRGIEQELMFHRNTVAGRYDHGGKETEWVTSHLIASKHLTTKACKQLGEICEAIWTFWLHIYALWTFWHSVCGLSKQQVISAKWVMTLTRHVHSASLVYIFSYHKNVLKQMFFYDIHLSSNSFFVAYSASYTVSFHIFYYPATPTQGNSVAWCLTVKGCVFTQATS